MGNPLAPLMADFFMASIEKKIFSHKQDFYPQHYFRYVDDTLCFFDDESNIKKFLSLLNTVHNNLKFTMEKSHNGNIPFLDIKLHIDNDTITTEIYRKKTFTGRLLNFKSIVPSNWKSGLIKTLVHRAYHLSSSWHAFHKEINNIHDILSFNNFPKWWLERTVRSFLNNLFGPNELNKTKEKTNYVVVKIPYYGRASIILKRNILRLLRSAKNTKIKICFVSRRLRSIFSLKSNTSKALQSSVIYKFQCSGDPNICYVGETGRQLIRRINDHLSTNTAITHHLRECQFCDIRCDNILENFKILHKASNQFDRSVKEALYIQKLKPSLNSQCMSGKKTYSLQLF